MTPLGGSPTILPLRAFSFFFLLLLFFPSIASPLAVRSAATRQPARLQLHQPAQRGPQGQALWSMAAQRDDADTNDDGTSIIDQSTLTLLHHITLTASVSSSSSSSSSKKDYNDMVHFYTDVLGLGLDPSKSGDADKDQQGTPSSVLLVSCGATRIYLSIQDDTTSTKPRTTPIKVGLQYASLKSLEQRLMATTTAGGLHSYSITDAHIEVVDKYHNVYHCRSPPPGHEVGVAITAAATGRGDGGCCFCGMDYVEYNCPIGTASKIALFYDSIFDATTTATVAGDGTAIALIGIGPIQKSGRAKQYLIFRESSTSTTTGTTAATRKAMLDTPVQYPSLSLCVGENDADFYQCYKNCQLAGILASSSLSSNPQQSGSRTFCIQNIIDMESGTVIFPVDHEIRSNE